MKKHFVAMGFVAATVCVTVTASAQGADVRTQLLARGAPVEFADRVAEVVATAEAAGLPIEPLIRKAMEGWAKRGRVPQDRILAVLDGVKLRLEAGSDAVRAAGLDPPPGDVVASAAEALGRGMTSADVGAVIQTSPTPEAAANALAVAASLAAQGLDRAAAVRAVSDALGEGRGPNDVFELPSVVAGLVSSGVPVSDVARRILDGGGLPLPPAVGTPGTPGPPNGIPPGRRPQQPPGRSRGGQ